MKTHPIVSTIFVFFFATACTTTVTEPAPSPSPAPTTNNPAPQPNGEDQAGTTREALNFVSPCTAGACGSVPSSSKSTKPSCAPSGGGGSCGWSDPDPDGTVSFAACEESKCGKKPDASVCPSGTIFKGAQCGNENEKGCAWHSACVPPPSTTPCPNADGCGGKPEIGVICKDGSVGDLECMKLATGKCGWQRTCE
jgi:hypothetical protein